MKKKCPRCAALEEKRHVAVDKAIQELLDGMKKLKEENEKLKKKIRELTLY